jgi:negative regulator of flagellin synthesis FlgM
MHIYGPAHLHGPQQIGPPHNSRVSQPTARPDSAPIRDEVEISDAARLLEQAKSLPEVRQRRIAAIRAQIAEGTYETQEKLDIAVQRLLDEIG